MTKLFCRSSLLVGTNTVIQTGLVQRKGTTVLFTNRSFTWFKQPSADFAGHTWMQSDGSLVLTLMADAIGNENKTLAFPVANPLNPQPPVSVSIRGDQNAIAVATDAAFAATWPIVLPLLACNPVS